MKTDPQFDGKMEWETKEGNAPQKKVHVVVKSNVKAVVEKQINELATIYGYTIFNRQRR